jgi:hypothetical protein
MATDDPTPPTRSLSKPRYGTIHLAVAVLVPSIAAIAAGTGAKHAVESALKSPLPNVQLAPDGPRPAPDQAYRHHYDFSTDWFTHHVPIWNAALKPYAGRSGLRYLEVGLFEGRSALWMLENVLTDPTSRLVGIDPFLVQGTAERWQANLDLAGASDQVTTIKGFSGEVLRLLPESDPFDVIYIDGSHQTADVLEDAVLAFRLLKPGGLLIFDDYQWLGAGSQCPSDTPDDFPKQAIDAFLLCNRDRLDVIHNGSQLLARKRPSP